MPSIPSIDLIISSISMSSCVITCNDQGKNPRSNHSRHRKSIASLLLPPSPRLLTSNSSIGVREGGTLGTFLVQEFVSSRHKSFEIYALWTSSWKRASEICADQRKKKQHQSPRLRNHASSQLRDSHPLQHVHRKNNIIHRRWRLPICLHRLSRLSCTPICTFPDRPA